MPDPRFPSLAAVVSVALAAATSRPASAEIDLEVANGAKVKGTFDPGDQVESLRVHVPGGARITAKARGAKGARARVDLVTSGGAPVVSGTVDRKGVAAAIRSTATATDRYSLRLRSEGAARGNYAASVTWAPATKFTGTVAVPEGGEATFPISVAGSSVVTVTAAPPPGSSAVPRVVRITGPLGFSQTVGVAGLPRTVSPAVRLPATGDYLVTVASDAGAGDLAVTVKVRPPKVRPRKIDLSSVALGGSGEFAIGAVIGPEGGLVEVPGGGGADPFDIAGSSVSIPPGALPFGTTIVVGSAPTLDPPGSYAPIGATVSYSPDGQKFAGSGATVTIPLDVGLAGGDLESIRVYAESGGVVRQIPGPYDFSVPGFVSFPVAHFTRYVAASDFAAARGLFSLGQNLNPPGDLALASGFGSVPRFLYYVFRGSYVIEFVAAEDGGYDRATFAGGGETTTLPAPRTEFAFPSDPTCVVASESDVWIATDTRIYRVDLTTDLVHPFAGTGAAGDAGDGGPAVSATFTGIADLSVDASGAIYVSDAGAARIRRISPAEVVGPWAGDGVAGVGADDVAATSSRVLDPTAPVADSSTGILYFADGTRVRSVGLDGIVRTRSGSTTFGGCVAGETGPAHSRFQALTSIAITPAAIRAAGGRRLLVTDTPCHAVYSVDAVDGTTREVLGTPGTPGFTPDGEASGPVRLPQTVLALGTRGIVYFDRYPTDALAGVRTLTFRE